MSVIYDTNYKQNDLELSGPGMFVSGRAQLRSSPTRPLFRVDYRAELRQFRAMTQRTQWNRATHLLIGTLDQRVGPLGIEGVGSWEVSSETEDREVADVYTGHLRLSLNMAATRLRIYGRYRGRKFEEDPKKEETIISAGGDFGWELLGFTQWEVGYRQEESQAGKASRQFRRETVSGALRLEFSERSAFVLEASRRRRLYPERMALVDGFQVPTEDLRWSYETSLHWGMSPGPQFWVGWEYQVRTSNDPDRDFDAHRGTFGVRVPVLNWAEPSPSGRN